MPDSPPPDQPSARSFGEYRSLRRFPGLDGLRAIAALMVVVYHCPPIQLPGWSALQHAGDLGVDIFFVLSGFLITALLLREPDDAPHRRLGRFMAKRALRIFPLYFVAVILYGLKSHAAGGAASQAFDEFLPWLLTFCADIHLAGGVETFPNFGIAWSLGVEEKFYLLWPLVAIFMTRRLMLWTAIAGIVASCTWRGVLAAGAEADLTARLYYAFDTRMDGILWGCVLAMILESRRAYPMAARLLGRVWIPLAMLATFTLVGCMASNGVTWRYIAMPVLATLLVGSLMTTRTSAWTRWLDARALVHIGMVSYGVYVLHPLVISVTTRVVGGSGLGSMIAVMVLSLGVTIGVATLSFVCFERHFLRLKDRWLTDRPRASAAAIAG